MLHAQLGANRSIHQGGVGKSRFSIVHDFANGMLPQKWAWPTSNNSGEFREHLERRFKNGPKNTFALKIVPTAGYFWCVSYRGHSIAPL